MTSNKYDFNPSPDAPSSGAIPDWLYHYLKRDSGTTASSSYPHWTDVLETDAAAKLWNRMTYCFLCDCPTEKRFDWYAAHFSRVIDEQLAGHDRELLGRKLLAHITGETS
jgi:hypothetical protein